MDGIRRYAGIDWARRRHAVCVIDERGTASRALRGRAHAAGLRELCVGSRASRASPSSVPTARSSTRCSRRTCRWSSSPAATSRRCAPATAWPATRTTAATRTSSPTPCAPTVTGCDRSSPTPRRRSRCGRRSGRARTWCGPGSRSSQQLAAHLALVFPGAVDLFDDLDSPIAQAFLQRFPSAERAAWLSPKRMAAWLAAQDYSGRRSGAELHARLEAAPAGDGRARPPTRMAAVTLAYVRPSGPSATRSRRSRRASPSSSRSTPTAPSSRACRGRAGPGGGPARRDRRLPGALPDARVARLPGRGDAVDPPVGAAPGGDLPLRLRQEAARRARRLRRGQPPREHLGGGPLPRGRGSAARPIPMPGASSPGPGSYVIWRCWQDHVPYDPARHRALQRLVLAQAA